jgi:very-short-patch-repair endonuclease
VLSVLGPPEATAADFARWASARGEPVALVEATTLEAAFRSILAGVPAGSLQRAARDAIAWVYGRGPDEFAGALAARSPGERRAWLAELVAGAPHLEAAAWLLAATADGGAPDVGSPRLGLERLVPALVALADPIAVLVVPVIPTSLASLLQATVIAAGLCEALRPRAVALTAAPGELDDLAITGGACVALARQGQIRLPAVARGEVRAGGRSRAERALHTALDLDRRTRGRFALSCTLGIAFNGQRAEVDLYDAELELAVEIDGWHHFREPDGYRRDRDKDLVLQRAGILVLRVLEQDVWDRLDYLVEYVAVAVADRQRTRAASPACPPR